jgi:hypothetical protein
VPGARGAKIGAPRGAGRHGGDPYRSLRFAPCLRVRNSTRPPAISSRIAGVADQQDLLSSCAPGSCFCNWTQYCTIPVVPYATSEHIGDQSRRTTGRLECIGPTYCDVVRGTAQMATIRGLRLCCRQQWMEQPADGLRRPRPPLWPRPRTARSPLPPAGPLAIATMRHPHRKFQGGEGRWARRRLGAWERGCWLSGNAFLRRVLAVRYVPHRACLACAGKGLSKVRSGFEGLTQAR